jgi:hypothetical protein
MPAAIELPPVSYAATLFKSKAARSIVLLRLSSDAGLFSVPLWESLDSLGLGTLKTA